MSKYLVKGRPTLCSMLHQGDNPTRILELIKKSLIIGTDTFGLEIEILKREYRTPAILKELFDAMEGKPCYVTNYDTFDSVDMCAEERAEQMLLALECGGAFIDVTGDMFCKTKYEITHDETAVKKQLELIDTVHKMDKEVLMSTHVLEFRTTEEVMEINKIHHSRGVDISKIVTNANNSHENFENFRTSLYLAENAPLPTLFLSINEQSKLHRIVAPAFSESLYLCRPEGGIVDKPGPGQPLLSRARDVVLAAYGDYKPNYQKTF